MSVNQISAYNLGYKNTDSEYEEIKRKLAKYGIASTGNKSADKARLQQAERNLKKELNNKETEEEQQSDLVPAAWKKVMNKLELKASGNIQNDYMNAIQIIKQKLENNDNGDEKEFYKNIKSELDSLVASCNAATTASMLGANALSNYNRQMLLQ